MHKVALYFLTAFLAVLSIGVIVKTGILVAQSQAEVDPTAFIPGNYDATQTQGEYYGATVVSAPVPARSQPTAVLGSTTGEKRIEVDLTNQRLSAYEGDQKIYEFLISSGKWGRTPTGTFRIWSKFRYKHMSGGSKELRTYYSLPNVPFTMFFANDEVPAARGFGIHGTYWHDNFGHPMSHGCINMKTEEAELIYNWAGPVTGDKNYTKASKENLGTEVVIYGTAPLE
jgi:lipoprotein-anchoring transpeptidase ErfK/SrfK